MTFKNMPAELKAFLAQTLPIDVTCIVDVTISANQDQRDAKDGKKAVAEITFPKGWSIETLVKRLCASNSPKVALQAEWRGKIVPSTIKWTCNEPGTKRKRTVTITQEEAMKAVLGEETYKAMLVKFGSAEAVYKAFEKFTNEADKPTPTEDEDDD